MAVLSEQKGSVLASKKQNRRSPPAACFEDTEEKLKSYIFPVFLEPDEDVWRAYVPELEEKGAATWGHTKEEALKNIQEVAQMVIEVMLEDGESLPPSVTVSDQPVVAVSVG